MSTANEIVVAFQPATRARAAARAQEVPRVYPARVARQLALAYSLQQRIDSGEFANQAALAQALGFSRERISKLMDLLNLAPEIQEEILFMEYAPGPQPVGEADMQAVLRTVAWEGQGRLWARIQLGS